MRPDLPTALRIAAGLVLVVVAVQWLLLDAFAPPPLVLATILVALSFGATRFPKPVAAVALLLCVATPLAAFNGFRAGALPIGVLVFDLALFGWLATVAFPVLRQGD